MKNKKSGILLIISLLMIIAGLSIIGYKLYTNYTSKSEMVTLKKEFFDSKTSEQPNTDAIAVLEFPKFEEQIAVIEAKGRDETLGGTLSRAAVHMLDTAYPWEETGNTVIAAHNDTFFKNVDAFQVGDKINVITHEGTFQYIVVGKEMVEPDATHILNQSDEKKLTLVTCNFTGAKRAVVFANRGEKIE